MKLTARLAVAVLVLGGSMLGLASSARADAPGKPRCDAEGKDCESCWEHYGSDHAEFDACAKPLLEKGLVEACRHNQGAGDQVYFCKEGTKVPLRRGCGACALDADDGLGIAHGLFGAALAAAAIIRIRARRRRTSG
ncbi:MAG: hypothetical protein U0271_19675 [Polyangiaceae bacterium]